MRFRRSRWSWLALAAVVTVAGYYLFAKTTPTAPIAAPKWLYATSADDIERITVTVGGRTESFAKTRDGWVFDMPAGEPVDMTRWSAVPLLLSGTTVVRRLDDGADDAAAYRLDPPIAIADIHLRGDRLIQVHIGDRTADGANYYVAVAGVPGISLVNAAWGQTVIDLALHPPRAR
jgi:hypothetical protein